ncbi:MAG: DUF480 domain-containing protein [Acidobacteria bacterium]|nr:DUF480 domain-containing protein [Acidobacteriota bacterium]
MDYRTIRSAPLAPGQRQNPVLDEGVELSAEEVRVLGCLVEKAITTPDYYPLTLNSLLAACNQKTSRDPVVEYGESEVLDAIDTLKQKGLAYRITSSDGGRVPRYEHNFFDGLRLDKAQGGALCVLLLRGPQTVGEIRQRTGRIYPFESLQEVEQALEDLATKTPRPLTVKLERRPGEKEARYAHLLSGEPAEPPASAESVAPSRAAARDERIEELEARVEKLEGDLERLREQLQDLLG